MSHAATPPPQILKSCPTAGTSSWGRRQGRGTLGFPPPARWSSQAPLVVSVRAVSLEAGLPPGIQSRGKHGLCEPTLPICGSAAGWPSGGGGPQGVGALRGRWGQQPVFENPVPQELSGVSLSEASLEARRTVFRASSLLQDLGCQQTPA